MVNLFAKRLWHHCKVPGKQEEPHDFTTVWELRNYRIPNSDSIDYQRYCDILAGELNSSM